MDRLLVFVLCLACCITSCVAGDKECNIRETLQTDPHPDFAETARNLQAQWVDKDSILVVASPSEVSTNIWLGSTRSDTGLFRFEKHDDTIVDGINPETLKISPSGLKIITMVTTDLRKMYVSNDGGNTWNKRNLPGTVSYSSRILLSEINPHHIVITTDTGSLYVSYDLGINWRLLHKDISLASFAKESDKIEHLFYTARKQSTSVNNLYRINLASSSDESPTVILENMYRFYVDDKYLFVSKENFTSSSNTLFGRTRRFYVSTDYFKTTPIFSEVQLPAAKWGDHVQVMSTHETGAFIHMSDKSDHNKGTLYVSDNTGITFTVSLKNHLFKFISILGASVSFHDFYEVNCVRGTYITVNVTIKNNTDYHSSVITYDNGASWQLLTPPTGTGCSISDGCSLHLHSSFSIFKSYATSNSINTIPLSATNAPGIIIAQGSIGKSRDYNSSNSVIVTSQDGGRTWTKPNIPIGQYTYGIADYGNIIAIVSDDDSAQYIWFSHDRGVCFKREQLDTTKYFKLSKGLLMDPRTTSLYAFALGLEGNGQDDPWRLIAINFGSILSSPCHDNDYIITDLGNNCILGYKETYKIAKYDSVCYTDDNYSPIIKETLCNCTYNDMECGFGYTPLWTNGGVLNCTMLDNSITLAKKCPPGDKYYYQSKTGLRIIAGNKCTNTTLTANLLAYEQKACTGYEDDSGIDTNKPKSHSGRTAGQVIGAIIIIISLMAAAGLTLYCIVRCRKPKEFHDRVVYKKIPLVENGFSDDSDTDDDLLN